MHCSVATSLNGGPLLSVYVGVSVAREQAMQKAGIAVPTPVLTNLLIDTGASSSVIDDDIVKQLALQPTGNASFHTPSTGTAPSTMYLYDVAFYVPMAGTKFHVIPAVAVAGCDFSAQGIGGLFGRDVLADARLTYSGPDGMTLLSF